MIGRARTRPSATAVSFVIFSELTTNSARHRADFEMLIQRKTELYPRNRRLFMDLEVAEGAGGLHVNVVSTDLDRMG